MKIIIGFNEFKNSCLDVLFELNKAGFAIVTIDEDSFIITMDNPKKDILEFYKILVNN